LFSYQLRADLAILLGIDPPASLLFRGQVKTTNPLSCLSEQLGTAGTDSREVKTPRKAEGKLGSDVHVSDRGFWGKQKSVDAKTTEW
jgi:hypothetical protein